MLSCAGRVSTVEADERAAAAAVGAVEAPTAVGCGTGGGTNVTVVAEAGVGSENPERKEAWRRFSALRAAAVERSWVSIAVTRAWHSRSAVWAVARWPRRAESLERSGAVTRSCSAVPRSIAWRSGSEAAEAATWVRARPSSTSWREGRVRSARCCAERVVQMGAQWSRWGGGPPLAVKAARGTGAVGRSPGVRPVLEPVLARRSGEGVGEKADWGSGAVWAGEAAVVFWGEEAAEVVVAGMVLLEARREARGVKTRGGITRTVKGGWSATCMVARRAGTELLWLCTELLWLCIGVVCRGVEGCIVKYSIWAPKSRVAS